MFTKAGLKGQGVGFLFTDNQIVQERFLVREQKAIILVFTRPACQGLSSILPRGSFRRPIHAIDLERLPYTQLLGIDYNPRLS